METVTKEVDSVSVLLPTDLRINNYVEANIIDSYDGVKKWQLIKVSGIESNLGFRKESDKLFFIEPDISTFNKYRRYTSFDNDCLRGVKITEYWLLKFGFSNSYVPNCYFKKLDDLKYLIVRPDNSVIVTEEPNIIISVMQIIKTEYVHQLQNLHFAFTGFELQIVI